MKRQHATKNVFYFILISEVPFRKHSLNFILV